MEGSDKSTEIMSYYVLFVVAFGAGSGSNRLPPGWESLVLVALRPELN